LQCWPRSSSEMLFVDEDSFMSRLSDLVERQGGERFLALALGEFGHTYVDELPSASREFFIGRCLALEEEIDG
jgi:hypothetical protein